MSQVSPRLLVLVMGIGLGCRSKPVPEPHNVRLSVIDAEQGDCAWIRYETAPPTCELIAWSASSCSEGIEMSWSDDANRALLHWGSEEGSAIEVEFRGGEFAEFSEFSVRDLPMPPRGDLRALGYNPNGVLTALVVDQSFQRDRYNGTLVVKFAGERYFVEDDLQTEGVVALAHSYRWSGNGWLRQASAVTDDGWEFALAEEVLADDPSLVPEASELGSTEPSDARALAPREARRAKRWKPDLPGRWRSLQTEHGELAWWRAFQKVEDTELVTGVTTVPVLYRSRERWREVPLHFPRHSKISLSIDGPLMVIIREDSTAVVFDMRTGKILSRFMAPIALDLWPSG